MPPWHGEEEMKVTKIPSPRERWDFVPAAQDPECSREAAREERAAMGDWQANGEECHKRRSMPGYGDIMGLAGRIDPRTGRIS
jgi:hypothetical protein